MWPFRKKSAAEKQRKALMKARRYADQKGKTLSIVPPEGVPLEMPLASLGQRIGAQLTDFLLMIVGAFIFMILLMLAFGPNLVLIKIVGALTFFMIRVPYYILAELAWNGRTIAKRWLGLRVVSVNGQSLTPHQIVVRNLMKEIEFFAPLTYILVGSQLHWSIYVMALLWVIVLLFVPLRNKRNQRIGDIIANTAVISDPKPILLRDLATETAASTDREERFIFTTDHLDQYGRFELQVLEKVLRANQNVAQSSRIKQEQYLADIVERIAAKISYPEKIAKQDHREFLSAFYRAQRAYLESKKLFGDARDDKFFREQEKV